MNGGNCGNADDQTPQEMGEQTTCRKVKETRMSPAAASRENRSQSCYTMDLTNTKPQVKCLPKLLISVAIAHCTVWKNQCGCPSPSVLLSGD